MLQDVRRHAGLGDPPQHYYNNVPESANALIKRGVGFKEQETSKFCQEMSVLLKQQKEDVDSAVIKHGPYRVAPKFSKLEVSQDSWFKKTANQKEACIKKFRSAKMSASNESPPPHQPNSSSYSNERPRVRILADSTNIKSAHPTTLHHIVEKAENLLNKDCAVIEAPGSKDVEAFMVENETMVRPHYVSVAKNGKVTCNDFPGWNAYKICAHSLAVAEKIGRTSDFLKWLRAKDPQQMNLTSLVTSDSNKGVGKKGSKPSTARRKGGPNTSKTPPSVIVDRVTCPSSSGTVTLSPSTVTNPPCFRPQFVATNPPLNSFNLPCSNSPYERSGFQYSHSLGATPPTTVNMTPYSSPSHNISSQSSFRIILLQLCSQLVRVCFGCSQELKPGGKIASPPHDLVIMTRMNRQYRENSTGEMRFKMGNVYFPLNVHCVKCKQPYFCPQIATLSEETVPYLTQVHLQYLREFGISLPF